MNGNDKIRIAHFSDLHFTSNMTWPPNDTQKSKPWVERLLSLKQDLKKQEPDILMVTGDIADNPAWEATEGNLEAAWKNARNFLEEVCTETLRGTPEQREDRLFIIPGNHDTKIAGTINMSELRRLQQTRIFRCTRGLLSYITRRFMKRHGLSADYQKISSLFDGEMTDLLCKAIPSDSSEKFDTIFDHYRKSRPIPDLGLFVFCLDSNLPEDSSLNFAQGAIAWKQAEMLTNTASEWKKKYSKEYQNAYKFLLIHHHPMPIPLSENSENLFDAPGFHLLRNAGNFMKVCSKLGIDFILHGHQHASGCSLVSFPQDEYPMWTEHPTIVIGAGSVQQPLDKVCSYNLIQLNEDGEWRLNIQKLQDGPNIGPYDSDRTIFLSSRERYRGRLYRATNFPILVGRLDIIVSIDENGDLTADYYAAGVTPGKGVSSIDKYPVFFLNESKQATIETKAFQDIDSRPNVAHGDVLLNPPIRQKETRDIKFGVHGKGLYTFSEEYCQWHKGKKEEEFNFTINKSYEALSIEINFPEEFPPTDPRLEVIKILKPENGTHEGMPVHQLLETKDAEIDQAETAACQYTLKAWSLPPRISLHIHQPIPYRLYRIVWKLPQDEYISIPNLVVSSSSNTLLQDQIRIAIDNLQKKFCNLVNASQERTLVQSFLTMCGTEIVQRFQIKDPIQVDLAINHIERDTCGIKIIAAVQNNGQIWGQIPILPTIFGLGEYLRGKTYLQREVLYYHAGSPPSRHPTRHSLEEQLKYQVSIPLLWLPEPPFWPRIGVFTISSETSVSQSFYDMLRGANNLTTIFELVHEKLPDLARSLGSELPFV